VKIADLRNSAVVRIGVSEISISFAEYPLVSDPVVNYSAAPDGGQVRRHYRQSRRAYEQPDQDHIPQHRKYAIRRVKPKELSPSAAPIPPCEPAMPRKIMKQRKLQRNRSRNQVMTTRDTAEQRNRGQLHGGTHRANQAELPKPCKRVHGSGSSRYN
jgi:hypothetical protein